MGLLDNAKADIAQITSNADTGFGVEMTLTSPEGDIVTVTGLHSKIHLGVDTDGNMVNSKKAHISISESFLVAEYYPLRNDDGEVDMEGHKISVKDSTGVVKNYVIKQCFPNETVGLITCILNDFE